MMIRWVRFNDCRGGKIVSLIAKRCYIVSVYALE